MVPLPFENVDTDQITPARFLRTTGRANLDRVLFYDWRFNEDGSPRPEFPLNQERFSGAHILLVGDNFGCGSSREHAPWAILAAGFRALISTGFADIFRNNAAKNGLITVVVDPPVHRRLFELVERDPSAEVEISMENQTLTLPDGTSVRFPYDPFARLCILQGKDPLGYLLDLEPKIRAYENSHPPRIRTR